MKYTITGFSEKFDIPKDEVIKNLNTTYKAYVTKEGKITYIDEQAARQEQTEVKVEETVSTISKEQKELNNNNALIDGYKAQINELKQELAKEREKNSETEAKLLEMMDKVIKLTENTQILMAQIQSQHQQLLIENSKKKRTIRELFNDFIKKKKP
mgnify:CR=1 FL=1